MRSRRQSASAVSTVWTGPTEGSGEYCSPSCPGHTSVLDGTTRVRRSGDSARHLHSRSHLDKPRLDIRPPLAEWCGRGTPAAHCTPQCRDYQAALSGESYVVIVDEYGHHGCHHIHIWPGQPPDLLELR